MSATATVARRRGSDGWAVRLLGVPGPERHARIALLVILGIGFLFRVGITIAQQPAILANADSGGYLDRAANGLWTNIRQPMGYSLFLQGMHLVAHSLSLMMVIQHVIGMVAAVGAYDAARRLGAGRLAALLPVACIALNLDVVYFEHAPLSEALFVPLIVLAVWAFARARTAESTRSRLGWVFLAALVVGALPLVRTVGLVGLPFAGLAAISVVPRPREALAAAGIFVATVVVVIGTYCVAQERAVGGGYSLVRGQGWAAYSGVAPEADCHKFTPPPGTRILCEKAPPEQRGFDATWYGFNPESPAFDLAPEGFPAKDGLFQAFADAARPTLPGQKFPFSIVADAAKALLPQGITDLGFDRLNDPVAGDIRHVSKGFVSVPETTLRAPYQPLVDLQPYFRLNGSMALLASLVILGAFAWGRRGRWTMVLIVLPVCASWTVAQDLGRYYTPAYILLAFALALAITSLLERRDEAVARRLRGPSPGGW